MWEGVGRAGARALIRSQPLPPLTFALPLVSAHLSQSLLIIPKKTTHPTQVQANRFTKKRRGEDSRASTDPTGATSSSTPSADAAAALTTLDEPLEERLSSIEDALQEALQQQNYLRLDDFEDRLIDLRKHLKLELKKQTLDDDERMTGMALEMDAMRKKMDVLPKQTDLQQARDAFHVKTKSLKVSASME